TPWNLVPLVVLIILSVRKVPPSLAIMLAALLAGVMAPILQPEAVRRFVDDPSVAAPVASVKAIWLAIAHGYQANSGIEVLDRLLSRGGMDSMLTTLWIIIGAVTFGTLLDEFKLLRAHRSDCGTRHDARAPDGVDRQHGLRVERGGGRPVHRARPASAALQSRVSEARSGSAEPVASVRGRRNGHFAARALEFLRGLHGRDNGVPTLAYLPFCFFNIASPVLSVLWGITGFK